MIDFLSRKQKDGKGSLAAVEEVKQSATVSRLPVVFKGEAKEATAEEENKEVSSFKSFLSISWRVIVFCYSFKKAKQSRHPWLHFIGCLVVWVATSVGGLYYGVGTAVSYIKDPTGEKAAAIAKEHQAKIERMERYAKKLENGEKLSPKEAQVFDYYLKTLKPVRPFGEEVKGWLILFGDIFDIVWVQIASIGGSLIFIFAFLNGGNKSEKNRLAKELADKEAEDKRIEAERIEAERKAAEDEARRAAEAIRREKECAEQLVKQEAERLAVEAKLQAETQAVEVIDEDLRRTALAIANNPDYQFQLLYEAALEKVRTILTKQNWFDWDKDLLYNPEMQSAYNDIVRLPENGRFNAPHFRNLKRIQWGFDWHAEAERHLSQGSEHAQAFIRLHDPNEERHFRSRDEQLIACYARMTKEGITLSVQLKRKLLVYGKLREEAFAHARFPGTFKPELVAQEEEVVLKLLLQSAEQIHDQPFEIEYQPSTSADDAPLPLSELDSGVRYGPYKEMESPGMFKARPKYKSINQKGSDEPVLKMDVYSEEYFARQRSEAEALLRAQDDEVREVEDRRAAAQEVISFLRDLRAIKFPKEAIAEAEAVLSSV